MLDLRITNGNVGMTWLAIWAAIGGLHGVRVRHMFDDELDESGRNPGIWQEWLQQFRSPPSDSARQSRRRICLEVAALGAAAFASFLLLDALF